MIGVAQRKLHRTGLSSPSLFHSYPDTVSYQGLLVNLPQDFLDAVLEYFITGLLDTIYDNVLELEG